MYASYTADGPPQDRARMVSVRCAVNSTGGIAREE